MNTTETVGKLSVWSKSFLKIVKNDRFALPKVVWHEFVGEVGKFVFYWCQFSPECCIPKIIKTGWYFMELFNK